MISVHILLLLTEHMWSSFRGFLWLITVYESRHTFIKINFCYRYFVILISFSRSIFIRHWLVVLFALYVTVEVPCYIPQWSYLTEFSLPSPCSFYIFLTFLISFGTSWSSFYSTVDSIRLMPHCWIYMECGRYKLQTLSKNSSIAITLNLNLKIIWRLI